MSKTGQWYFELEEKHYRNSNNNEGCEKNCPICKEIEKGYEYFF